MLRTASADSVASDLSALELGPSLAPLGQIEVGLEYDTEVRELVVSVIQAKDLQKEEHLGIAMDHYVKVEVMPKAEEEVSHVTKVSADPKREGEEEEEEDCLLYTSPSPRDLSTSRMPSSA